MKKYPLKKTLAILLYCLVSSTTFAQEAIITINASLDKKAVSPYIYGRNEGFDKSAAFYNDAGLRFARCNGGNNATKYNWRKKITSHPDWYNNVYSWDWDALSKKALDINPNIQIMWAFQLLGKVAKTNSFNFNDWAYNQSNYWAGVHQNLAGGGAPNQANPDGKALVEGDTSKYLMNWPADSTVAILHHWFGEKGIGLNKNNFKYWSMDNECDIWHGTHDDVMNSLLPAWQFLDKFINVAKKARVLYPEIKICGPVTTSEWQWYKWGEENIYVDGKYYCWFEYFIKRCADEEKTSGIRVLDVFDIHQYPYAPTDKDALQNHRAFYDKNYVYPGANGIKTINGGWDNSQNKEYIFKRVNDWLDKHYGAGHGITVALSEWSPGPDEPNLASVIYATHLGLFANNGVEFFTPWNWFTGMWETLHLFSRNAKNFSVSSTSSIENTVSAYTTINHSNDSMTVMLVNRDMSAAKNVEVNINNFIVGDGSYITLQLSSLPSTETFKSHTDNALKKSTIEVKSSSFTINIPALSTTAVLLTNVSTGISEFSNNRNKIQVFPNPAIDIINIYLNSDIAEQTEIAIYDTTGRKINNFQVNYDGHSPISLDLSLLNNGAYLLSVTNKQGTSTTKFTINK